MAVRHASGSMLLIILTCICMQNVIKICHLVQELRVFSLTANAPTDSHGAYSADPRVAQSYHEAIVINLQWMCIHLYLRY